MKTEQKTAIKVTVDHTNMGLAIQFAHGKTLSILVGNLSHDIRDQALLHGLKQKLVDAAAISRNSETGLSATIEDKFQAVLTVRDRLVGGDWNAVREGGGNAGGLLLKALIRLYDGRKTVEQIKEFLAEKTDAEKAALRKNQKVAALILEIQAESAAESGIDTDALLDELE